MVWVVGNRGLWIVTCGLSNHPPIIRLLPYPTLQAGSETPRLTGIRFSPRPSAHIYINTSAYWSSVLAQFHLHKKHPCIHHLHVGPRHRQRDAPRRRRRCACIVAMWRREEMTTPPSSRHSGFGSAVGPMSRLASRRSSFVLPTPTHHVFAVPAAVVGICAERSEGSVQGKTCAGQFVNSNVVRSLLIALWPGHVAGF